MMRLAEARDGGFDVSDDAMVSIRAGPRRCSSRCPVATPSSRATC
jgi:hypothetical protein